MKTASLFTTYLFTFAPIIFGTESSSASSVTCKDDAGHDVDWFILYKIPVSSQEVPPHSQHEMRGLNYVILTSRDQVSRENLGGWTWSDHTIDSVKSAPGRTLSSLDVGGRQDLFYVNYNDEHPNGVTSMSKGHTKGVVSFDKDTGFWMIHSIPKFPQSINDSYTYPKTGQRYGQTMLCITIKTEQSASKIGNQLMFNNPYIFESKIPKEFFVLYPKLAAAASGKHIKKAPFYSVSKLFTFPNAISFISFAKYTKFHKDLYSDLVGPVLKSNLFVETWINERGVLNSTCSSPYNTWDVRSVQLKLHEAREIGENEISLTTESFDSHKDHAKWAVSGGEDSDIERFTGDSKYVTCIGDINRVETQFKRGGGTVCMFDENVWRSFKDSITEYQKCN